MKLPKPAVVTLSLAQHKRTSKLIRTHQDMGDLTSTGFKLIFTDSEGAKAFQNALLNLPHSTTTREYITINAIWDKINQAVQNALSAGTSAAH